MLEKIGKDVFSKIKNQLKESQKDEIEFLSKHFSRRRDSEQSYENQCNESFLAMSV